MICKCNKPAYTTNVNVTADSGDGTKKKINPIHLNLDICCNYESFEKLMDGNFFDVDLALVVTY